MDFCLGFCKRFCGFSVTPEDFFPPERFLEVAGLADPFVEPAHRDRLGGRRVLPEGRVLGEPWGREAAGREAAGCASQRPSRDATRLVFFFSFYLMFFFTFSEN